MDGDGKGLRAKVDGEGEILIFDIQFVRLACFNPQFADLSKYDLEQANSFDLQDSVSFSLFLLFFSLFSFYRSSE
jgi:hypothetical protein